MSELDSNFLTARFTRKPICQLRFLPLIQGSTENESSGSSNVYTHDDLRKRVCAVGTSEAAAPTAFFSVRQSTGAASLPVMLTDQAVGTTSLWEWFFDNSGITDATAQNPGFTCNTFGTYSARLTVACSSYDAVGAAQAARTLAAEG
jgi:PKD repeat protein